MPGVAGLRFIFACSGGIARALWFPFSPQRLRAGLQCREAFERFDKDGSGTIDAWELKETLKAMGQNPTDEEVFQMLSQERPPPQPDSHTRPPPDAALTEAPAVRCVEHGCTIERISFGGGALTVPRGQNPSQPGLLRGFPDQRSLAGLQGLLALPEAIYVQQFGGPWPVPFSKWTGLYRTHS